LFLVPFRARLLKTKAEFELKRQDLQEQSNLLKADMDHEQAIVDSLQKKIENYSQLKHLMEQLSVCLSLEDTINTFHKAVDALFEDHRDITTIFYLLDPKTGELGIFSAQKKQRRINIKSKAGDMFDEWLLRKVQPLLVEDARSDFRFDAENLPKEDHRSINSVMSVPLIINKRVFGIFRLDSPLEKAFSMEDLRFLTTLGDLAALAIGNAQLYERIEDLAIKDGLTGLYLRRYLIERLGVEMSRQLRHKKELSFLMIDLDKFKLYNDQYGHMAGDRVLKELAALLRESFSSPEYFISRYGGEEFAVVCPDCPKEEAIKLAEKFRKTVQSREIILRKHKTHMTVSVGIAAFPTDALTQDELIHLADQAMYEAKNKGRNCVCAH